MPRLVLHRDAENAHDPSTIAVRSDRKGTHLGYLPAGLAARLAPEIDAGTRWEIAAYEVLVMPGHESNPGLSLSLRRAS